MILNMPGRLSDALIAMHKVSSAHSCVLVRTLDSDNCALAITTALATCGVPMWSGAPIIMQKDWQVLSDKALTHYDELWFFASAEHARLAIEAIECPSLTTDSSSLVTDSSLAQAVESEMCRVKAFMVLADGALGVDVAAVGEDERHLCEMIEIALMP